MKSHLITMTLFALASQGSSAIAQSGIDVILAAAAQEERATFKQAELHYAVGDKEFIYQIRRQLPDRVYVRIQSEGQSQETIAIGTTTYFRTPEGWQTTTLVPLPHGPISLADLLSDQYRNVQEATAVQSANGIQRKFVGEIEWTPAHGLHNEGTLSVLVGQVDLRLRALHFEGRCSGTTCAFDYLIDYEEVPVEAPM
ncbi:hypothetical protein ATY76_01085 [Rhizobium sp. R339]|uniref:hypothetical protein n=1 Tax=Rhizobium sp. R339 TaxID=1764273 RepID=UPI000B52FAAA|nr:hypothetical protein [Rhizobium sp. R339]OWV76581.1 hypothetical protein ATY76_01085 [Rhizobium sp. R339]